MQRVYYLLIGIGIPWAYFQIRNVVGCVCAGNAGNVFPGVSDPDMHHGTWVRDTMCGKTMMQSWN